MTHETNFGCGTRSISKEMYWKCSYLSFRDFNGNGTGPTRLRDSSIENLRVAVSKLRMFQKIIIIYLNSKWDLNLLR